MDLHGSSSHDIVAPDDGDDDDDDDDAHDVDDRDHGVAHAASASAAAASSSAVQAASLVASQMPAFLVSADAAANRSQLSDSCDDSSFASCAAGAAVAAPSSSPLMVTASTPASAMGLPLSASTSSLQGLCAPPSQSSFEPVETYELSYKFNGASFTVAIPANASVDALKHVIWAQTRVLVRQRTSMRMRMRNADARRGLR